jgi:hypothetical protein
MNWRRRKSKMSEEAKQQVELNAAGAALDGGERQREIVHPGSEQIDAAVKQLAVDPRSLPPPAWFDQLVGGLFFLYPGTPIPPQTLPAWWLHLCLFSMPTLAQAFADAPRNCPVHMVPSAELVRRVAEAIMKDQQGAK